MTYKSLQSLPPALPLPWPVSYVSPLAHSFQLHWSPSQGNSCLRALAFAVPSARNSLPRHICIAFSLPSFMSQLRESFLTIFSKLKNSAQTIIPVSLNSSPILHNPHYHLVRSLFTGSLFAPSPPYPLESKSHEDRNFIFCS